MPPNERGRVVAQAVLEDRDRALEPQVPGGDAAVPEEPGPARPRERRAREAALELFFGADPEHLLYLQVRPGAALGRELGPAAPRPLRLVVRAYLLANVAPEGPVAHRSAQFARDLAGVLYG